jgi:hypothetical protein
LFCGCPVPSTLISKHTTQNEVSLKSSQLSSVSLKSSQLPSSAFQNQHAVSNLTCSAVAQLTHHHVSQICFGITNFYIILIYFKTKHISKNNRVNGSIQSKTLIEKVELVNHISHCERGK